MKFALVALGCLAVRLFVVDVELHRALADEREFIEAQALQYQAALQCLQQLQK